MTRSLGAFDPAAAPPVPEHDRVRLTPSEGWTALIAVLVMLLAAAMGVDDSNWAGFIAGTDVRQTEFLPFGVFLAAIIGLVLAKSRLSALKAHFVGAAVGAAYILIAVAGAVSGAPGLQQRLRDLNLSVTTFVDEAVGLGIRSAETSVFLLILGALLWAAGQFAAFSVFRRRRGLPAIAIPAAVLLINMSITVEPQYLHLVVLTTAALWLLVRLNLLQQIEGWRARRIGDGGYVSELFMRSGAVFVAIAILGSVTLAANASSAPLQRYWDDADEELLEIGYELNRWIGGVSGPARGPSNLFAPSQTMRDFWESSPQVVFTATSSDGRGYYMRGAVYDSFDGQTWQQLDRTEQVVPVGQDVFAGTLEQLPYVDDRREVTLSVTSVDMGGSVLVSPESPLRVDRAVELVTHTAAGGFVTAKDADGLDTGETYTVSALVRETTGDTALTASDLASAGVEYDTWLARYVEIRPGSVGEIVEREADRIVSRLPGPKQNPYHIAEAIQNYLWQGNGFQYQVDVRGLCDGRNRVDCFLQIRRGYCEYFATTMVMMLRTQAIPARYVLGYLPGQLADGTWTVDRGAAHAWVEVYFPGYGWVRFDPTPGNRENGQVPTRLDPGAPLPTVPAGGNPRPSPRFTGGPALDPEGEEGAFPGAVPNTPENPGGPPDLLGPIALAVLVVAVLLLLVAARFRRLPGAEPEFAYRSVARLASRFGHGPRPTQTAYEFSDGLGQLVPAVRSELRVVATAKVEATYARRQPHGDALQALREAYARVRIGLLRLLIRRPSLPRRARGTQQR
jgi:hypothetical protein